MKPHFVTGAKAKIVMDDRVIAYCTNLSYRLDITSRAPKVLGMYESVTVVPLTYIVNGTFTIIKSPPITPGNPIIDAKEDGNSFMKVINSKISKQMMPKDLTPSDLFNIFVYVKNNTKEETLETISLKNCRIIGVMSSITKNNIILNSYTFMGCYFTEDGTSVGISGRDAHTKWE